VQEQELFGKTFDQQLQIAGDGIVNRDISPNRRIPGEIVFEPVLNGVRVTARDENHRTLWGFIVSKGMLELMHCPVAIYQTLRDLLSEELKRHSLSTPEHKDAIHDTKSALDALQKTIDNLKESIKVKKVSSATIERATAIARIADDVNKMILLETSSIKGMKTSTKQQNSSD